ncbi:biogenesis of lysosome-related organelles complex 1 subunit 1 [Condylostylus longicornis]|uniref:biogenesis of lysosome-related organelles complex 1 subunit 1 n=1 Tax=Condylostylus longicornis TaxID=2530218 RepID=UPI00244E067C|nr:biogenesis of lysosome-related organelles complex 1 subunit 1 [Condylostylus longicornis]
MLSSMVKEHESRKEIKKEEQEIRRKDALDASRELTQALVDHLNVGVAQAYLNQKRLDAEAKQLQIGATNFAKQTQQWLHLIDNFTTALKELGDVENWAKSIENDMHVITDCLEIAYKKVRQPVPAISGAESVEAGANASGNPSGSSNYSGIS